MKSRPASYFFPLLFVANIFCSKAPLLITAENNPRESHKDIVIKVKYNSDGKMLASGGNDSDLILWEGKSGKYLGTLKGQYDKIFDIAFVDSSREIITANYSGSLIIWDSQKGIKQTIKIDSDFISSFDFNFPEKKIFTASWDRKIKILEIENKNVIKECKGNGHQVRTLKYSQKNKTLFAGTSRGYLVRWLTDNCETTASEEKKISEEAITSIDLSDDLNLLVVGASDGSIKLFDLDSLKETGNLAGHKSAVNAVKINFPLKKIFSADKDGKIFVWDINSHESKNFTAHSDSINSIDISPDGKRLASGSSDRTVKVWNIDKILSAK